MSTTMWIINRSSELDNSSKTAALNATLLPVKSNDDQTFCFSAVWSVTRFCSNSSLISSAREKPLCVLFGSLNSLWTLDQSRLCRYAIALAGFDYLIFGLQVQPNLGGT
ncbi:hypothetical protein Bpfe_017325 [Biomphalaria pfeifferi]|uniref:Uncharacterized protein n=1 Tax=Biomphalaria pfeifferi TaxID=112525 RepID=A0AAD8BG95_BIOPF|nr:hypothetical protein Bpfe_017325 [Biomphalaria pfeifferi]